jgi:ABC-type polysaccharide/polyol phosphate export permease
MTAQNISNALLVFAALNFAAVWVDALSGWGLLPCPEGVLPPAAFLFFVAVLTAFIGLCVRDKR